MTVQVKNNIPKVKEMMLRNIFNALDAAGNVIMGDAKERAPVDRNFLREKSIKMDIDFDKKMVRVGSTSEYAIYVEKGTGIFAVDGNGRKTPWAYFYDGYKGEKGWRFTRGQKPQPFLTPAGEENIDLIIKVMAIQLKKGFE